MREPPATRHDQGGLQPLDAETHRDGPAAHVQEFSDRGHKPAVAPFGREHGPTASERGFDTPLYDKKSAAPQTEEQRANSSGFDRLARTKVKKADAPRVIRLPDPVTKGLQESWDRSHPKGSAQEQGGNIVRNKDGSYDWRQGKPGGEGVYLPDEDDVGKGQKLVGAGHTHPYANGTENVSFSGEDISSLVNGDERLEVVQSGKMLFMVVRTAEFDAMVDATDDDGARDLMERIEKCWNRVFESTKGTMPERAQAATVRTCREFKLAYYRGTGATLDRVE